MFVLQLLTILGFGLIAFQDFKERAVLWVLFPLVGLLLGVLHLKQVTLQYFIVSCAANLLLVSTLLFLLWGYTRYVRRQQFLNVGFGLGDVLFLYAFGLGFPTLTFILLLTCSIFFSLLCQFTLAPLQKSGTVPLAGLMGLFLMAVLCCELLTTPTLLYSL
ncbi:MAG: hypothetical protein AAGB24_15010 [Bacteroidota bacterium]